MRHRAHLNNAGAALMPAPVLDAMTGYLEREAAIGGYETAAEQSKRLDGVYDSDPRKNASAKRFDRLGYADVLSRDLKVMDGAAIALARDNGLPVIVFSINEPGNLLKVLRGDGRATVIA